MKKILFNDKYHLTEAVLQKIKNQTRRVINNSENLKFERFTDKGALFIDGFCLVEVKQAYNIGEIVAISESYASINDKKPIDAKLKKTAGWKNKMFVKAELMPHHIKITDVRVQKLQDISEDDCIAEGIEACGYDYEGREIYSFRYGDKWHEGYRTGKKAYAGLIDKVGKTGTWEKNPYVFVYNFELID